MSLEWGIRWDAHPADEWGPATPVHVTHYLRSELGDAVEANARSVAADYEGATLVISTDGGVTWTPYEGPQVVINPALRSGDPTVKGIRVEVIAEMMWHHGDAVEETERDYGLTRGDTLVACWYMGVYGSRTWRSRWGRWAKAVHPALWRRDPDYAAVPLPPSKREAQP